MPTPIASQPITLLSAEKDVLQGVLAAAPESRTRDSILSLVSRTGMADGEVSFTQDQRDFLVANLPSFMDLPAIQDSKYGSALAREVAQGIVDRLTSGTAN
ncbi:MAG: hypothetical protein J0M12_15770 [Deltaproteobacteria bacterium]|nr:hypothetical protein [Deltaproteobacteria bacterium]